MKHNTIENAATKLTDTILGRLNQNLEEILELVAADMDLRHISYMRFYSVSDARLVDTIVTYSVQWQTRYYEKQYIRIDPVISHGSRAVLPFDWSELANNDPGAHAFFADASNYGVGRNGISIPVRNRTRAFSLVSFTSDHRKEEWDNYKKQNMPTLQILSNLISSAASITGKVPVTPASLSRRERQCLILAAGGKSYDDVAEITNLELCDVKRYLDTARHKLYAINLAHAIAIAVATGIIPSESLG